MAKPWAKNDDTALTGNEESKNIGEIAGLGGTREERSFAASAGSA